MTDLRERPPQMKAMGLGFEFAATLAVGSFAGVWVDRHYGTAPWGVLVGALVGLVVGFLNFLRVATTALGIRGKSESHESKTRDIEEANKR